MRVFKGSVSDLGRSGRDKGADQIVQLFGGPRAPGGYQRVLVSPTSDTAIMQMGVGGMSSNADAGARRRHENSIIAGLSSTKS